MSNFVFDFCIVFSSYMIAAGVAKLAQIANTLREIRALIRLNTPDQPEEEVSPNELCRRFRVKLELAQQQKRRR